MRPWPILLVLVGVPGCGGGDESAAEPAPAASGPPLTVQLAEENGSGQAGTATLRALDDKTFEVRIEVDPSKKRSVGYQLAHLHSLSCADYEGLDDYEEEVESVADELQDTNRQGVSVSTVYVPIDQRTTGSYSINLHEELRSYEVVACGDIPTR